MNETDFREKTIEILSRLETLLTVVCGKDGTGGTLSDHDKRIRALEERTAKTAWIERVAWGFILAAVEYFFHRGGK